jgi:hypothetical protein
MTSRARVATTAASGLPRQPRPPFGSKRGDQDCDKDHATGENLLDRQRTNVGNDRQLIVLCFSRSR